MFLVNVRIMARILRVFRKQLTDTGAYAEYQNAENTIWRLVQNESISKDTLTIEHARHDDLWCAKTKLGYGKFGKPFQFPIILPANHPAVD